MADSTQFDVTFRLDPVDAERLHSLLEHDGARVIAVAFILNHGEIEIPVPVPIQGIDSWQAG